MAIYLYQKNTGDSRSPSVPLELISNEGIVVKECRPSGTVRIGGELWNAKSLSGSPIDVGETVIVRHVEGLLVLVELRDDR
jgi:membrane-bound ClpP family serine protease